MKLYGIDYIIIGLASFLGGVYYAKKFYKDKYNTEKEEAIESVKQSYKKHFDEMDKASSKENKESNDEIQNEKPDPFTSKSSIDGLFKKNESPDEYLKSYVNYSSIDASNEDAAAENEHPEDDTPDPIREITIDDYMETNGYAKREISYYTGNDVYVREERDEDEPEIVDDPHTLFGFLIEKTGWKFENGSSVMYIRNDSIGTDFEVSKYNCDYDW